MDLRINSHPWYILTNLFSTILNLFLIYSFATTIKKTEYPFCSIKLNSNPIILEIEILDFPNKNPLIRKIYIR